MKVRFLSPELATLVHEPFSDPDWIFEEKFDGIRCIAVKSSGTVTLFSRNRKKLNQDFPDIVKALEAKKTPDFVIDGEIVAFEGKVSSFSKLQQRKSTKVKCHYYVFDLLLVGSDDLRSLPLLERKRQLKGLLHFGSLVHYTTHRKKEGEAYFKQAAKKGLEGVIAKQADSSYRGRRTRDWLKFKCMQTQEMVIGGYTDPQGSREGFGALLVGFYEGGKLHYAGKVGTGFDEKLLLSLSKKLSKLTRSTSPFATKPKEKGIHFVKPTLKCKIGFTEWTKAKKLRHARFLGCV